MAKDQAETNSANGGSPTQKNYLVWGAVFLLGATTGVAFPLLFMQGKSSSGYEAGPAVPMMDIPAPDDERAYVPFEEVVVNLNDNRYSRYLTVTFALQVAGSQELAITELVEKNRAVLKNWLIAHLRDKKLEDVGGKLGHNLLRREIHDRFNEILFLDGVERIQDVLFEDFKVQ
ncbi:MAG: hypothetical protein CBB71_22110 [Rhodopirellula sp. TMED11]|nr:MAG: hypothetical protein CBB71_22110 [Rhodopirellula sp. TMED11]